MCCLFGFVDYGHQLTRKQRSRLLTVLSVACEDRGTDATGIAYNYDGRQHIYKRPLAAHLMWYRVPLDATVVMGHTRMTTQGSEKHNENNHPFHGYAGGNHFDHWSARRWLRQALDYCHLRYCHVELRGFPCFLLPILCIKFLSYASFFSGGNTAAAYHKDAPPDGMF